MLGRALMRMYKAATNKSYKEGVFFNSGGTLYKQGNYDLAIKEFNEAIKLDPQASYYYLYRALAYKAKGMMDAAGSDAKMANILATTYLNSDYCSNFGVNVDKVIETYKSYKEKFPNDDEVTILVKACNEILPSIYSADSLMNTATLCVQVPCEYSGEIGITLMVATEIKMVDLWEKTDGFKY